MVDRLILWLGREGWIGVVPMLLAAGWLAREAWAYRQVRVRHERRQKAIRDVAECLYGPRPIDPALADRMEDQCD